MADQGWIALHRSIRDHWLYQEKRTFSKYEAWLDLLMDANHQNKKILFDGSLIEVRRGQKITSIRQLCDRWSWSNTKVNKFLKTLEADGMLIKKSDSKKTLITIVNYDSYQKPTSEKTTVKRQQNVTETSLKHTNNNVNNDNNVNKDDDSSLLQEIHLIYEKTFGVVNSLASEDLVYWCKDLSPDLVKEALIRSKGARSFKYTESILKNWEKYNAKTLEDVEKIDKDFAEKATAKYSKKGTAQIEYVETGDDF